MDLAPGLKAMLTHHKAYVKTHKESAMVQTQEKISGSKSHDRNTCTGIAVVGSVEYNEINLCVIFFIQVH